MSAQHEEGFASRGGRWVVVQSALMLAVLIVGPATGHKVSSPLALSLSAALLLVGAVFGIGGVVALGQSRTIFPKPLPDAKLVRHGVFSLVRHPLYSSLIFLSFGWALWWHSGAVAVLAVLLAMLLHCKSVREEWWLRAKFPEYTAYAAGVKRFIPWII